MTTQRKTYSAEFKGKVAIEAIRGFSSENSIFIGNDGPRVMAYSEYLSLKVSGQIKGGTTVCKGLNAKQNPPCIPGGLFPDLRGKDGG